MRPFSTFQVTSLGLVAAVMLGPASVPPAQADLLLNGDFEADASLGPGQSFVDPFQSKNIVVHDSTPGYFDAISAIPHWQNSLNDESHRDAGLRRIDFDGSGSSQYAYINNWDTRLSQVSSWILKPGDTVSGRILVGFHGLQAGRFQLWAGEPSAENPDIFSPSAVLLTEVSAGGMGWTLYVPDLELTVNQWHELNLNYVVPSSGPMVGQPLTLSFLTSGASAGPTFWDNAFLSASQIPEPPTFGLAVILVTALTSSNVLRRSPH